MKHKFFFLLLGVLAVLIIALILGIRSEKDQLSGLFSSSDSLGKNIIVTAPANGAFVRSPLIVSGSARVFENQFRIRLRDQDGTILIEMGVYAHSPDVGQYGSFQESIIYLSPHGSQGTVEVFDYSAKDGSEIDMVQVPVIFKK